MAWTTDDVATLEAAIASGTLSVTFAAGPGGATRSKTFQSLPEMRAALAQMRHEVFASPTHRLAIVNSGFRGGW